MLAIKQTYVKDIAVIGGVSVKLGLCNAITELA